MVGECFPEPLQHGLAKVIFDDVSVTVFVNVAEQEFSACEFVEDEFHIFFVEFGEAVFRIKFCGKAHLDKLRLYRFGQKFSAPVFFLDFFAPGIDGEFLEFFENLWGCFLRENFLAGKFGGGAVGVFGFADFDSDESFLAAAPQKLVAGLGFFATEHSGAEHAERENRVGRFCNLQANHVLVC